jgi:hypothetical protein
MAFAPLTPLGLLGGPQVPQAPAAPETPTVGFTSFDDYANAFHKAREGSLFGGGVVGVHNRDMEMAERGVAPFTAAGVGTALSNASGFLRGAISPLGLAGLMTTAGNVRPDGLLGRILGGNIQSIPGQTPYDRDLIDALNQGRLSRAQITAQQLDRNAARSNPGGGAQHDRQGVSAGAGPGGRGPLGGGAYGGGGGVGGYGV